MKKSVLLICIIFLVSISLVSAQSFKKSILEGESQFIFSNGQTFKITLVTVADSSEKAIFKIGDESSKPLGVKESHEFSDGSKITIIEMLIEEGKGADYVEYYFHAVAPSVDGEYVIEEPSEEVVDVEYKDLLYLFEEPVEPVSECSLDEDCDDQNPCTLDICSQKRCIHHKVACPVKEEVMELDEKEEVIQIPELETPKPVQGFFAKIFDWFKNLF